MSGGSAPLGAVDRRLLAIGLRPCAVPQRGPAVDGRCFPVTPGGLAVDGVGEAICGTGRAVGCVGAAVVLGFLLVGLPHRLVDGGLLRGVLGRPGVRAGGDAGDPPHVLRVALGALARALRRRVGALRGPLGALVGRVVPVAGRLVALEGRLVALPGRVDIATGG